ncbi:MAG: protoporphyrinogen oxidase [Sulfurifustaceae bacterium]
MAAIVSDVIVVGGGISGLATAFFLRRRGMAVSVLEAGDAPGGTIQTIERDGFLVDTGPTSTLYRGGALGDVIDALGLQAELLEADRRAARYIVKQDVLVPLPLSLGRFVTTPLFSAAAKLRLLAEPLHRRATGEESIAQFVRRRIGPEFLDWAVDPFVSGVYAGDPERLSVRAAIPRLYALEAEHGSLFIGALARAFAGKGGGAQPRGRLISFRRGMQSLPRALANDLGAAVHLNAPVVSIEQRSGEWIAGTARGEHRARRLVLAVPSYHAASLLAPVAPAAARDLEAISYPPVASVALGFRRDQVRHPLDGFGALLPRRLGRETLGVIFSSTLFPGRAPAGHVLLTAFIGGARNAGAGEKGGQFLADRVLSDLAPLLGLDAAPIFRQVTLWSRAIPQYNLGHLERVGRIERALQALPGLYLRANWRDGVSLADSVEHAKQLASSL